MPIETVSDSGLDDAASAAAAHWLLRLGGMHQTRWQRHVSCSLAVFLTGMGCAHALELGDAAVMSALGQSLRVEIPYRASGSERIDSSCVSLAQSMNARDGVPAYTQTSRITVSATHIQVIGDALVREPLIALDVRVQCAGVPHLVRSYLLFVDPPVRTSVALPSQPVAAAETSPVQSVGTQAPAVVSSARPDVSPRARGEDGVRLTQGQTYRVVRGDTLSGIASRIDGRPGNIWATADEVFAANRQAFTNGNPDLLEEGRSITIPMLGGQAQRPVQVTTAETASVEESASVASTEPQAPISSFADDDAVEALAAPPVPAAAVVDVADTASSDASALTAVTPVAPAAEPAAIVRSTPLERAPAVVTEVTPEPPSASVYSLIAIGVGFMLLLSPLLIVLRRRGTRVDTNSLAVRPQTLSGMQSAPQVDKRAAEDLRGAATPRPSVPQPASAPAPEPAPVQAAVESEEEVTVTLSVPSFKDRGDESYSVSEIDHLDLDVGSPVWSKVTEDWSSAHVDTVSDDEPTVLLAEVEVESEHDRVAARAKAASSRAERDTQKMTNIELEMLRQDYETELTLTQQNSQALRDAIADLEATQAMFAASGESPTYEAVERALTEVPKTRAKPKPRSASPKKPKKRRSPARARSR